ncbi:sugar phosphate isomerase/epimerase family protein [Metabacillus halosaccharovorans]|uniref:sugar phosphate isomerase/epimerase family protein n=1 Tax=Metabacillus halosaccharovorans TaxID=930124 RepID=UPI00203FA218|nr:sugar phosphate isomerase/epimerase [Metabacillus halosaccharovorans]MCM3443435.1 sugar phosphate isomerase/epimerase [Metabacillus halosaccharovorans]
MKLSICTISFRHHLYSIDQIAHWAKSHQFDGIELWGVHAKNLQNDFHYGEEWLYAYGLETSMISDYLPLDADIDTLIKETNDLSNIAKHWGTNKIRTFVGRKGSEQTNHQERKELVQKVRLICEELHTKGQYLLVETHPNTLADQLASTLKLLQEVHHPALRINFDVLHVWESGIQPIHALRELQPYISHFHLKNISSREKLSVFAPDNVYAAAGSREGIVPLFQGQVDYREFLSEAIGTMDINASLEWFGGNVKDVLKRDGSEVRKLHEGLMVKHI